MSGEQKIQRLFLEAQALAPEARTAFVAEHTEGDPALRDELLELLSASADANDFFQGFASRVGLDAMLAKLESDREQPWPESRPGDVVGAYKLVREFGRGGMGVVWLAERTDGRFEGQVAIKLLAMGGIAVQRFKLEGYYLARLSHPNIARLLDAGVTDDGQPFLVLEHADGVPIDEHCANTQLTIEERIRLFLSVIGAVSHAHSHLIVHRDLKPANILVTAEGEVKLLDFGVAKLLAAEGAGHTRDLHTLLTPAFAAPEQLLGGPITTAADTYALGLLLYLLLAGRNPRDEQTGSSIAELQALATTAPPKLSDYATAGQSGERTISDLSRHALKRRLQGDLDNILQKALAAEPAERYATVAAFADDLTRYLRHEPVRAQPPTVRYRVGKFVRRHRGGVVIASLMLIVIIASAVVTTWQMVEAQRQRDIALEQQQRLQATNEFLALLVSDVGSGDEPLTLADILDGGIELIETQYSADAEFAANMLFQMSAFYSALGADDRRLELLDRAIDTADRNGYDKLGGHVRCARSRLFAFSDTERAQRDVDEGRQRVGPLTDENTAATIDCHRAAGLVLAAQSEHDASIAEFEAAIAALDQSPLPADSVRATLLNDMAEQYFATNRMHDAVALLEQGIALNEDIGRGNVVSTIISRMNLATVIASMGEVASAASNQQESLARLDHIGRPLIGARAHYARSLMSLSRFDEALPLLEADLRDAEEAGNERWTANSCLEIGTIHARRGDLETAEEYLERAEDYYRLAEGGQQWRLTRLRLVRIGSTTDADPDAALEAYEEMLSEAGYPAETGAPELATILRSAARIALDLGDAEKALTYATSAYELASPVARDDRRSAHVGLALALRGEAHLALGDRDAAAADLEIGSAGLDFGYGPEHEASIEARRLLQSL